MGARERGSGATPPDRDADGPIGRLSPDRIARALADADPAPMAPDDGSTAGVIFLVQDGGLIRDGGTDPTLLLTKRSPHVPQPGDLCCPGGRLHPGVDGALGWLLRWPGTPLTRSPGWRAGAGRGRRWRRQVSRHWACGLRECWEEIGLAPFGVTFLGLLPPHRLSLFRGTIVPLVARIRAPRRFRLNGEVERLVAVPFSTLLDPARYGTYRVDADWPPASGRQGPVDFPCFFHGEGPTREILWGATYAITLTFLDRVLGFAPPPAAGPPGATRVLSPAYATGRPRG